MCEKGNFSTSSLFTSLKRCHKMKLIELSINALPIVYIWSYGLLNNNREG